ncbi:MAG: hypothetical protein HXY23_11845 [Parvularculaceae bacterium]|jgi:hypothetical protein|nr:hypothetical protein [Parvularculaceae bacterium]
MNRSHIAPAPVAACLAGCLAFAPPVLAHHHDESPAEEHAGENGNTRAAAAAHDEAGTLAGDELPANDLSTALGSKISSPSLSGGSLHASPKILNNTTVSNDLKAALEPRAKPAVPASGDPAVAAAPPSATVAAPETIDLQIAPTETALPEAGPARVEGAPARPGGPGSFLPLLGVGAFALAAGFIVARVLRGRGGRAS